MNSLLTKVTPSFSTEINLPPASSPEGEYADHFIIVLRYYGLYGNEWKTHVTPARITYANQGIPLSVNYAEFLAESDFDFYIKGQ